MLSTIILAGCRDEPSPTSAAAPGMHGDHKPHHGGLVMMRGDLHYEIVFDPRDYQVYFTDAVRRDLPPSIASAVSLTVVRPGEQEERIDLRIDPARQAWVGRGAQVTESDRTTVRLAFTVNRDPYWIDLPFSPPADAGPAAK
jgi:hypothetical protein